MHTPMTGIAGLGPDDARDPARLLGMIVALAGEVFVLKAEIDRMKIALNDAGVLDEATLEHAGASKEMQQILRSEEEAFASTVLRPFAHPDDTPDVSRFMGEK